MPLRPSVLCSVPSMPQDVRSWSAHEGKPLMGYGGCVRRLEDGYAWPVSKWVIFPPSSTVKLHFVFISPQVSLL